MNLFVLQAAPCVGAADSASKKEATFLPKRPKWFNLFTVANMETIVKRNLVFCLGVAGFIFFGVLGAGCSDDAGPASKADAGDAGKLDSLGASDIRAGTGGRGAGGSLGTGGSTSVGGTTGTGGTAATGGMVGAGGAAETGGSIGAGGVSASGGVVGTGGIIGSGGSTQGSGGAGGVVGLDAGEEPDLPPASDVLDVPLPPLDVPAGEDVPEVEAGIPPVLLDSAALDTEGEDGPESDTVVAVLDAAEETAADAEEPEAGPEAGIDATPNPIPCPEVVMLTMGEGVTGSMSTGSFGTAGNYCFATCDDIAGWGGSNLEGRTLLLVNQQEVTNPINGNGAMPLPTPKVLDIYTVFQISGGSYDFATIYWWGDGHECSAPVPGFGP